MWSLIREHFCPAALRRERLQNFLEAQYEDIPNSKAIRKFREELTLLGPTALPDDQHVYLFFQRSREGIRSYLAGFRCESLLYYQDREAAYERDHMGSRRVDPATGPEKKQLTGITEGASSQG